MRVEEAQRAISEPRDSRGSMQCDGISRFLFYSIKWGMSFLARKESAVATRESRLTRQLAAAHSLNMQRDSLQVCTQVTTGRQVVGKGHREMHRQRRESGCINKDGQREQKKKNATFASVFNARRHAQLI